MKFFALLALLFASPAFAGQANKIKTIGFSEKGSYYAFATYGTSDGSGAAYAWGYIVSVKHNKYVTTPVYFSQKEGDANAGNEAKAIASVVKQLPLSHYGITAYKHVGEELLVRPLTDKSEYNDTIFTISGEAEGGAGPTFRRYSLVITETDAPESAKYDKDNCNNDRKLLKLTLKGEDKGGGALETVLQDDKSLPNSRECSSDYEVRSVTTYKDGVVVAVSFTQGPGFEGKDVGQIVVTAKQPLE